MQTMWASGQSRSRTITCFMTSISSVSHMDLPVLKHLPKYSNSVKFLLWWQRGPLLHCPLPSVPFLASCLLCPTGSCICRGLGTASAWLPGSSVPWRSVMTSSIGIWLLALNGKFAFVLFWCDLFFLFAWFLLKQMVFWSSSFFCFQKTNLDKF